MLVIIIFLIVLLVVERQRDYLQEVNQSVQNTKERKI